MPPPAPKGRPLKDWFWPRQNRRWWFTDDNRRDIGEDGVRALLAGAKAPTETLEQAQEIARAAVERAAAAERRAGVLGGTVAIAASLMVGGAGLVLDSDKIPSERSRFWFAVGFAAVTVMFGLSGLYAARAVVKFRVWSWPEPYGVTNRCTNDVDDQILDRAAETLHDFAHNWEVAYAKLRALDSAFRAFTVALLLLMTLAIGLAAYHF